MATFEILEAFISLRREVSLLRAAEAKESEFGNNQIGVLYRLSLSSATMGELTAHTLSDKASMTRTVSLLEKAGLVRRIPSKIDRRVVRIELTTKGKIQAHKAVAIRESIGKKLERSLAPSERKQLTLLIQKISENIQSHKS